MAKTVKMKKGGLTADIFDSPETIAQAQKEGYVLVSGNSEPAEPEEEAISEEVAEPEETKPRRGRTSRQ